MFAIARSTRLVLAASALVLSAGTIARADDKTIAFIELDGHLHERQVTANPFGGKKGQMLMRDLIAGIDKAAGDPNIAGLLIQLKDAELKGAQIEEVGRALNRFRAAGKRVHLFAENYGTHDLHLGSYADEVILQQGGEVSLPGIYMEEMFLADTFKWVGITPDFVQIGDYKGASEQMANSKPSKAWDENINGLLDSMYGQMRAELKRGRKLTDAQLDKAMENAWMADGNEAKKSGLIDASIDLPELKNHLKQVYSATDITWETDILPTHGEELKFDQSNPFAMMGQLGKMFSKPEHEPKRETIAVLHIDGAIVDGDSGGGGLMGGGNSVGARTIRRALKEIEKNDLIKGLVVRIDSPGGSAIASEVIWQGLKRVSAAGKPVYASVGSMAASGGYYIAVGSDKIYVNPSSIVGSIGVVGGKMALGGAYEKLKINVVPRSRGPRGSMMASATPWSEADKKLVRDKMTQTYNLFTSRVTAGRKGIDLSKTAEGRLFLGDNAVKLSMADSIGGLEDAAKDMAKTLNLASGSYDLMDYPAPKGFDEVLEDLFGKFGGAGARSPLQGSLIADVSQIAQGIVGPRNWDNFSASFTGMMQLQREPVLVITPSILLVK
jgi:protease-4